MASILQVHSSSAHPRWRVQWWEGPTHRQRTFPARGEADDFAVSLPRRTPRPEVTRHRRPYTRRDVVVEETEFLLSIGETGHAVAHLLGVKPLSIERALYRAGRPDLARQIAPGRAGKITALLQRSELPG